MLYTWQRAEDGGGQRRERKRDGETETKEGRSGNEEFVLWIGGGVSEDRIARGTRLWKQSGQAGGMEVGPLG